MALAQELSQRAGHHDHAKVCLLGDQLARGIPDHGDGAQHSRLMVHQFHMRNIPAAAFNGQARLPFFNRNIPKYTEVPREERLVNANLMRFHTRDTRHYDLGKLFSLDTVRGRR
jgi:hypothetical protein